MLEVQSRAYRDQYGCNFVTVIPCNIYGPNDNFNLDSGHVIPSLIHKCYLAKKNDNDFIIKGSGKPLRQFIYNLDLAKLILKMLFTYEDKEPIILSVSEGDEVSIAHVARTIAKWFKYEERIKFDCDSADGQFKKTADNQKLMKLYPETEFTSIDDGIATTVEWFNITPDYLIRK